MNITVQIPDDSYRNNVGKTIRIKGSLQITSDREGNFRPWKVTKPKPQKPTCVCPLRTGKASFYDKESIKVNLDIDLSEKTATPAASILQADLEDVEKFLKDFAPHS